MMPMRRHVRTVPWIVTSVTALPRSRFRVRFIDGTEGDVDMGPFLAQRRLGVFEPLRRRGQFVRIRVDDGVMTWPCGADLAPDALYEGVRASGCHVLDPGPADASRKTLPGPSSPSNRTRK
jgi:hypothetical protein